MIEKPAVWHGDNPFFLAIVIGGMGTVIDLDEPQWVAKHAALMREEAVWTLVRKGIEKSVVILIVNPGEQPYYTARHIGIASGSTGGRKAEMVAYGIGKKRLDGHVDRLWVLPNGLVCAGDDVEPLALGLIKAGGM